jgi:riboflavin biosynthesis pyrimidine reductase
MLFLLALARPLMTTHSSIVRALDDLEVSCPHCEISATHLARHLPVGAQDKLPIPVILDCRLRMPVGCKLLTNYKAGRGRQPWIICSMLSDSDKRERRRNLEEAGAKILQAPLENGP